MKAVHIEVLANAKLFLKLRKMRLLFSSIGSIYHEMKKKQKKASNYVFSKLVGKCFKAWLGWVFLVGVGLDRKRWIAPGKYEIKYNQKQVDNFSRLRCERMCYTAWKRYSKVSRIVNLNFTKKLTSFMRSYLFAWRDICKRHGKLMLEVIDNWTGYANIMMSKPFVAWKGLSKTARLKREAQDRLMRAYRRWKLRQKVSEYVK